MDFRLKNMKNIILTFAIFILITSCNTYKKNRFEYNLGKKENEWINNFKTEFFFSCIKEGYKNDTIIKLISKKDLLYQYEPYAYQHNKIDSLAINLIKRIPKPIYQHCDDCTKKEEIENNTKNYFCASCLNYFASRELDSIAKNEYKKINKKL